MLRDRPFPLRSRGDGLTELGGEHGGLVAD